MSETLPRYDAWKTNVPVIEIPSETCAYQIHGKHELDEEHVVELIYSTWNDARKRFDERTEYACPECFKEMAMNHLKTARPSCVTEWPWDSAEPAVRCDDRCGRWNCECP